MADQGLHGVVPVKKPARGQLDMDTKTRNAPLRMLRRRIDADRGRMKQHTQTAADPARLSLATSKLAHTPFVTLRAGRLGRGQ